MKITKEKLKQIIKEELEEQDKGFVNIGGDHITSTDNISDPKKARELAITLLNQPAVKAFKACMDLISRSGGARGELAFVFAREIADATIKKQVEAFIDAMKVAAPDWFTK